MAQGFLYKALLFFTQRGNALFEWYLISMLTGSIYLTDVCQSIATMHYRENRLLEALDAMKEAWKHAESRNNLAPDQADLSLLTYGYILFSASKDTAEAWKYIKVYA